MDNQMLPYLDPGYRCIHRRRFHIPRDLLQYLDRRLRWTPGHGQMIRDCGVPFGRGVQIGQRSYRFAVNFQTMI